jgi:hypothetical protein
LMGGSPVAVALYAADALEFCGVRYVVGGSLASSVSGEPRSTLDVDIVVEMSEADVVAKAKRGNWEQLETAALRFFGLISPLETTSCRRAPARRSWRWATRSVADSPSRLRTARGLARARTPASARSGPA